MNNNENDERHLVEIASSYCASHGILMGARDNTSKKTPQQPLGPYIYEPAPFSLYPTPFPKHAFEKAYRMALPFNGVVHKAASSYYGGNNGGWLRRVIGTAARGDEDFTGRLVRLADEVVERGRVQNVALGILRSDYMLHSDKNATSKTDDVNNDDEAASPFHGAIPLQVELNTIASSFGCLSSKVTKLHAHMQSLGGGGDDVDDGSLPDNMAADGIADGLAAALEEYVRQKTVMTGGVGEDTGAAQLHHMPVVVMVVQPGETNSIDQRDLEFLLQSKHSVRLIRRTLSQLATEGQYNNNKNDDGGNIFQGRELLLPEGNDMVAAAVVYYRAGYTPNDYPTEREWKGREIVEHSSAIKCPDVFYHIFGSKKVQQALSEPSALRQFTESDEEETLLSSSFASLFALGEGDDSDAVKAALDNPHDFVLKPQREGGGNNLYDSELHEALTTMSYEERGGYILMAKIKPPSVDGKLVRGGQIVYSGGCVCELGVFGITLREYGTDDGDDGSGGRVLMDQVVGHILRSKSVKTDEGGVAAGYAFLSSPVLV